MRHFHLLIFIVAFLGVTSCKKDTTPKEIIEVIVEKTAREKYTERFTKNDSLFHAWQQAYTTAQNDSLLVTLPYTESGIFKESHRVAHSYTLQLRTGEHLIIALEKQQDSALVFIDLFKKTDTVSSAWEPIKTAPFKSNILSHTIDSYGFYTVVIQSEINKTVPFQLKMYTQPAYTFPVIGTGNTDVKSFWAANRGAGKRTHEGIDIYANKGTPVIAIANGKITSTEDGELGGKQVWLEDNKLGTSIYYAHLDKVLTKAERQVSIGDTLGLVGNTGNAKDLEPHLHFGIFLGDLGPVDPYPYIKQTEIPEAFSINHTTQGITITQNTIIHQGPSFALDEVGKLSDNDTISILGQHRDWYHMVTSNGAKGFVNKNNIKLLLNTKAQD